MSLPLPNVATDAMHHVTPGIMTVRRRAAAATVRSVRACAIAVASAAALLCALPAAPALAQSVGFPGGGTAGAKGFQPSGDPGMAEAEKAAQQRRYAEAIERFDRVIAANPRNVQARFERAWALSQAGREDEAVQAFHEIAQEYPELPEPHNNLALIYARRGDLKRAEAELLAALEAKPGFAIGYTNLGDVYRKLAERSYAEALKRNPGDARARSGLAAVGTKAPANTSANPPASPQPRTRQPAAEPQAPVAAPPLPRPPGPDREDLD
ncbi:tetratricopeptide repeat protein [Cupriavidus cauae]|uniref:Tetratricopeptide repeat protein n=1 Tax=Cupriavidus cauae TaxID=2608999 RepID=A0A5M8BCY4_9BURK|nr:tetratricopeptide repeat protein [Cupriavidus cauae]KAA6133289.1 tetratricopeptide repeat protein [Cupriavidus cauae]UZN48056.1 tetratricopeptide repeat protein [Cupriavidus cauae]